MKIFQIIARVIIIAFAVFGVGTFTQLMIGRLVPVSTLVVSVGSKSGQTIDLEVRKPEVVSIFGNLMFFKDNKGHDVQVRMGTTAPTIIYTK